MRPRATIEISRLSQKLNVTVLLLIFLLHFFSFETKNLEENLNLKFLVSDLDWEFFLWGILGLPKNLY